MHTFSRLSLSSRALRALAGLSLVAAAAGAQAGGVYWSVNVDAPVLPLGRVVTAVSNVPAPVVVYRSAPVVVQQPPVYHGAPYQVIYQQPPVVQVVAPRHGHAPWWGHRHHHHHESRHLDRGWDRWDGGGRDGGQHGRGDDSHGHRRGGH